MSYLLLFVCGIMRNLLIRVRVCGILEIQAMIYEPKMVQNADDFLHQPEKYFFLQMGQIERTSNFYQASDLVHPLLVDSCLPLQRYLRRASSIIID